MIRENKERTWNSPTLPRCGIHSMLCHPAASAESLLGFLRLGATMRYRLLSLFWAIGLFAGNGFADDADKIAFFEAKIRPVLVESCLKCHGETKHNGNLRLD